MIAAINRNKLPVKLYIELSIEAFPFAALELPEEIELTVDEDVEVTAVPVFMLLSLLVVAVVVDIFD